MDIITINDKIYNMAFDLKVLEKENIPEVLREIPQPPKKLYIAGDFPPEDTIYLCVVGSRRVTNYGKDVCKKLIAGLKGYPIAIVSGLAVGIDSIAHESALENNLFAVAFPGSGISERVLYPVSNLNLAEKIVDAGGCVISEFPPEMKAELYTFPMRNRLMAGLSKASLIIEAQEKSGTLITARLALDYNREVLAVPGPINSENSKGTNRLIRQGATPITSSEDILEALGFKVDQKEKQMKLIAEISKEEQIVLKLLADPQPRDDLIRMMKTSTAEANTLLSIMEIKGLIKEELGEIRASF